MKRTPGFVSRTPLTVGAGLAFSWTSTGALVGYWAAIILLT
ncbi:MAG: hypothetical protein ABSE77_16280 [Acidimicrobiales bacterium]